jgi:hypothetical protein
MVVGWVGLVYAGVAWAYHKIDGDPLDAPSMALGVGVALAGATAAVRTVVGSVRRRDKDRIAALLEEGDWPQPTRR